MGSGVKASILSTLTAKILSTMLSQGMTIDDAIAAYLDHLRVERGASPHTVAFGVSRVVPGNTPMVALEGGQYSVPHTLLARIVHGAAE